MKPVNQRERISQKGWRTRNRRLVALGEVTEFRSIAFGEPVDLLSLSNALRHVEGLDQYRTADDGHWIEFRKAIELWPDRQKHPELEAAYQAVADMPQMLPDQAEKWDELRFQAERLAAG